MTVIKVCLGSSCYIRGNDKTLAFLQDYVEKNKKDIQIELVGCRCTNLCQDGPNIFIDDKKYSTCAEEDFAYQSSKEAREFALTGGVAHSVQVAWKGEKDAVKPVIVNGLDKASIRDLRMYAKTGKCPAGNLIEVMCCPGGCIAGNACLGSLKDAFKKVKAYGEKGQSLEERKKV